MGCCFSAAAFEGATSGQAYELPSKAPSAPLSTSGSGWTTPLSPCSGFQTPYTSTLQPPPPTAGTGQQTSNGFKLDPSIRSHVSVTNKPSFSSSYHGHAYSDAGGSSFVGIGNVGSSTALGTSTSTLSTNYP
ncbi:hypothetical protein P389DRAFT_197812 [Cystobasidium minutum MCA 4210]|uniref:uncharacterized protein n=1 Tax=Cystobasidium minutum MCA 4210 TaxID=1397322 RepID=UPI0034CFBF76|eukprot:jgi/Rhomi1/197812/gm1.6026_g